jgi:RNA polymerase sigma factor (sigma-70 family)
MTIAAAMRKLPEQQRQALALRYLADYSEQETAMIMGITVGSVKTHLKRGKAKLRSVLGVDVLPDDDPG